MVVSVAVSWELASAASVITIEEGAGAGLVADSGASSDAALEVNEVDSWGAGGGEAGSPSAGPPAPDGVGIGASMGVGIAGAVTTVSPTISRIRSSRRGSGADLCVGIERRGSTSPVNAAAVSASQSTGPDGRVLEPADSAPGDPVPVVSRIGASS